MSGGADEFDLIAELFAPLAAAYPGALGLKDDAALMDVPPGCQLVLTKDAMVAGVHFFADDPADLIARKLIRVNLSDLAAKGAKPVAIMLATAFPKGVDLPWLRLFAAGLAQDCAEYGIAVIGGDTVSTPGPLTLSLTAFGVVERGRALLRSGARAGDRLWLSGTLGDGALGLKVCQSQLTALTPEHQAALRDRYHLPRPRTLLGPALLGLVHAAMDVSDGLIQDVGHLARASGLRAVLQADQVPLSAAAAAALTVEKSLLATVLGGGDDYEILFAAPLAQDGAIRAVAARLGVRVTPIGMMMPGQGVSVLDGDGKAVTVPQAGWRHFDQVGDGP